MTQGHDFDRFKFGTVKVGERGQVVIPSGLRESMNIKAGDRLVVLSKQGKAIVLIPAERFEKVLTKMTEKIENIKDKIK